MMVANINKNYTLCNSVADFRILMAYFWGKMKQQGVPRLLRDALSSWAACHGAVAVRVDEMEVVHLAWC